MNILIINKNGFDKYIGGIERISINLGEYLSKNNQVSFLQSNDVDLGTDCDKFNIYKANFTNYDVFFDELNNIVNNEQIDVIINQTYYDRKLIETMAKTKAKIITVMHTMPFIRSKELHYYENIKLFSFDYLKCFIYELSDMRKKIMICDKFVFLSNNYAAKLNLLTLFLYRKKITYINNFTESASFNVEKKDNIILYVGRLEKLHKDAFRIILIWEKIYMKLQNYKLVIVGDGAEKEKMSEYVEKKKIDNVIFTGQCNPESYYKKAKILALTSSIEGFPMVLIEALTNNVIPIAFNSFGASKDIIKNGVNGYTIPSFNLSKFSEKITYICKEEKIYSRLVMNIKYKKNKYTSKEVGKSWDKLLNEINGEFYEN